MRRRSLGLKHRLRLIEGFLSLRYTSSLFRFQRRLKTHAAIREWLRAIFVYFLQFNKDGRGTQSPW